MNHQEKNKLEKISQWYSNRNWGFYTKLVQMSSRSIQPYFKKGSVLEVGPADGEMTRFLLTEFSDVSVIDASKKYIDEIKKLDPKIRAYHSLIEEFKPPEQYDNIVLAHVLEHVVNPISVLKKLQEILKEDGVLVIITPNAMSLHRQVGVKMNLLKKVTDLNEADILVDHKRVYTPQTLRRDIKKVGLLIKHMGGIFLKPLSNQQIDEQWSDELIEGYYKLGNEYPEIAADILAVCKHKNR